LQRGEMENNLRSGEKNSFSVVYVDFVEFGVVQELLEV
jgi:hypothetical protein